MAGGAAARAERELRVADAVWVTAARLHREHPERADLSVEQRHALQFASLRARGVRAPDAAHLACAARALVDRFVTADARLHGLQITGIGQVGALQP